MSYSSSRLLLRLFHRRRHPILLSRHLLSSSSSFPPPDTPSTPAFIPSPRGLTRSESQFNSWVSRLSPGFTADDLASAVRAESDPDLALDLFRWASLRPGYRHSASSYHAALSAAIGSRRFSAAESLVDEVLAGACPPDLLLLNTCIRFCSSRKHLFSRAFDLYKKMQNSPSDCAPNLETYSMLLSAILKRLGKPPVSYVYLKAVRSLAKQMKMSGIIPDTYLLNLIIKAYSRCLEMDDALIVFREMPLYNSEPNDLTYGYLIKGLCEKGRTNRATELFQQMREKGFVPTGGVSMVLASSLAMESRFEEAIKVVFDMVENGKKPDVLTYRTLMEGLCREGRADEAFELLEELRKKRGGINQKVYDDLIEGLHWICQSDKGKNKEVCKGDGFDKSDSLD
ncbi:hypothetical protein LUZ60_000814 [Juncus effusus]|nr:hypothetical protein LUZ60_000814 [Juncus effusus]